MADHPKLELERFLPYRLNVVAEAVSRALSRLYAERYGIGIPEWRVLATLGQYERMTARDVGAHSRMHKTKVSRAVSDLETRGLVQRAANRDDKREAFLALTGKGRQIYADLAPLALGFEAEVMRGFSRGDLAAFDRMLRVIEERTVAADGGRGDG